ncbi:MAG: hypothetical protein ACLS5E_04610 [[Ruminococcus] lactaris]
MDIRVSLKQALKSLGFQGGNKHDTEMNQWINHEKEVLAEIAKQHGIEWEQKGTHEEHLDVYNFKKERTEKGSTGTGTGKRISDSRERRIGLTNRRIQRRRTAFEGK